MSNMETDPDTESVAHTLIDYAKASKDHYYQLRCPDCKLLPLLPITGKCGHTRCSECIHKNGSCYCGSLPMTSMHVNIYVKDLITKILACMQFSDAPSTSSGYSEPTHTHQHLKAQQSKSPLKHPRQRRGIHPYLAPNGRDGLLVPRSRYTPEPMVLYNYAQRMLAAGRYDEAAPHLARIAATISPVAKNARDSLIECISELLKVMKRDTLTADLSQAVQLNPSSAWLNSDDFECIICYNTLRKPVTTDCGHTFCRDCILRTVRENQKCAVCRHPLDALAISLTSCTKFVTTVLKGVMTKPTSPDVVVRLPSMVIPIYDFEGLIFPACTSFMFDPDRMATLRRILDSGKHQIGIATRNAGYHYGTLVEVRDCVSLQDGWAIVSTVGISRFRVHKVLDEGVCTVARAIILRDKIPYFYTIPDLKMSAEIITEKIFNWYSTLQPNVFVHLMETYGEMPLWCDEINWWMNPNGPMWLWWIITVLPISPPVQLLMFSSDDLFKRMIAVSRSIELITNEY